MAVVAELARRLDHDGEPLAKRLCLAENVFQSPLLPVHRKEEVVINWLCQLTTKSHKKLKKDCKNVETTDMIEIWSTLRACLCSAHMNQLGGADVRPSVKGSVVKALCKHLKKDHAVSNEKLALIECAISVLESNSLQHYFRTELDLYMKLLCSVLTVLKDLVHSHQDLCVRVVSSIQSFSRQTVLKSDFIMAFLTHAMSPLIQLLAAQTEQTKLSSEVNHCVQQILFPKTSSDFNRFLEEIFKEEEKVMDPLSNLPVPRTKHIIPFKLMDMFCLFHRDLDSQSFVCLCSTVFTAFVSSNKRAPGSSVFRMFCTICHLTGFNVKSTKSSVPCSLLLTSIQPAMEEPTESSLHVLKAMLMLLSKWSVPLSGEMFGTSFLDWLQMMVENMFPLPERLTASCAFLDTMTAFVQLNPMTIEMQLKTVLEAVLAQPITECTWPAYSTLLCALLSMYMKLHRVHVLVSTFLSAIKVSFEKQKANGCAPPNLTRLVPADLITALTRYAALMPSASATTALDALLHQLKDSELELLQHLSEKPDVIPNPLLEAFVHILSELLCALLSGVRMLEQSVTPAPRAAYIKVMENIRDQLKVMGDMLLKIKNNTLLMRSFLRISHCWGAVAIMVRQYCVVGRQEMLSAIGIGADDSSGETGLLTYLHPYLSDEKWQLLIGIISHSGDTICTNLLLQLQLQLLCALHMFENSVPDSARDLAKSILPGMVSSLMGKEHLSTLGQETAASISLITPLLDETELTSLADTIIECLLTSNRELSKKFLSFLQEDRSLTVALACSIFNSLRRVCRVSKRRHTVSGMESAFRVTRKVLGKLDTATLTSTEAAVSKREGELVPDVLSMAGYVVELLQLQHDDRSSELMTVGVDLSNVSKHLQLLELLPLKFLSSHTQAAFFFCFLCLAFDCSHLPVSTERDAILSTLYQHLLLGMVERGVHVGPKLNSYIDLGLLVKTLASNHDHNRMCHNLLKLMLIRALRQEDTFDQVLDKIQLLTKKATKKEISECDVLLATLIMQDICTKRIGKMRLKKAVHEPGDQDVKKLKSVRRRLVKNFRVLVEGQKTNSVILMHAFALTLDYLIKFNKSFDSLCPHIGSYCNSAVLMLKCEDDIKRDAAVAMITTVLRHRNVLDSQLPHNLVCSVWSTVIEATNHHASLFVLLFEKASRNEMALIMETLKAKTEDTYGLVAKTNDTEKGEENKVGIVDIWRILLSCQNLPVGNSELCLEAVQHIITKLHKLHRLPQEYILQFLHTVLTTSRLAMDMQMVDHCLLALSNIGLADSLQGFLSCAQQYLSVLSALLLHRPELALDCVPSFLQRLQLLLMKLASHSQQRAELSHADAAQLASVAFGVEKLINVVVKPDKKKAFKRVAAYLISDIIKIFEEVSLCASVKIHFQNIVFALLKIVDDYSIKFLLRTMSPASNEIFKMLYENYKKFYRFTGKV